jgi:hypothetical protein
VVVRRLHSNAGASISVAQVLRLEQATLTRRPCLYPWERIVLNPRGQLSFCPADWANNSSVADYRLATIKDTWQGEIYGRLRRAHLTDDYAGHVFCGQCPDWSSTRWPGVSRSYADMIQDFKATE